MRQKIQYNRIAEILENIYFCVTMSQPKARIDKKVDD